jgi:hypothetical protein
MIMQKFTPAALVLLLLTTAALAEGPTLKPGKWEFVTTSKMPMLPEPRTETSTECITEEDADPAKHLVDEEDCTLKERKTQGDTLKWTVECRTDEGSMSGNGHLTANGTTANGGMEMKVSAEGMEMTIETDWKGKRIGDCD